MPFKTTLQNVTVTRSVSFDVYNNGAIRAKFSVQQAGQVYLCVSFNSGLILRLLENVVECGVLSVSDTDRISEKTIYGRYMRQNIVDVEEVYWGDKKKTIKKEVEDGSFEAEACAPALAGR